MKKNYLLISFLLISGITFGQYFQNPNSKKSEHKLAKNQQQLWNSGSATQRLSNSKKLDSLSVDLYMGGTAIPYAKELFTYNGSGKTTSIVSYENDNMVMHKDTKEDFTYDANNRIIERLVHDWDTLSNQWKNRIKETTTFTATSNTILYYHWDNNTNQWLELRKTENFIGPNSLDTLTYIYNWNNQWNLSTRTHYTYNSNNDITLRFMERLIGTTWVNDNKVEWTYDANFNKLSMNQYQWDAQSNMFVADFVIRMGYDNQNNKIYNASASYDASTSSWEYSDSSYYYYAANANLDSSFDYSWNGITNSWEVESKYEMDYNNNYALSDLILPTPMFEDDDMMYFNHMFTKMKGYDENGGQWALAFTYDLYYSDFIPTGIEQTEQSKLSIAPNPAQDYFTVKLENNQLFDINIYDSEGRLIKSQKASNNMRKIDIKDLKSGIYFIQITDANNRVYSSKLIKR